MVGGIQVKFVLVGWNAVNWKVQNAVS